MNVATRRHVSYPAFILYGTMLFISSINVAVSFVLIPHTSRLFKGCSATSTTPATADVVVVKMGVFDDVLDNVSSSSPSSPKVEAPADFVAPQPQPLTLTPSSDLPDVLKSSLALALRLGTGAFVLGWKIDSLFYNNEEKDSSKYALSLGPFRIRDSSTVLAAAPRPVQPLVLYEYDASPFCKRVREMINILDLTVEYRPCPGARNGKFSQQMFETTGRRTVPYLVDPNTNVDMFESDDIIQYLLRTYGPTDTGSYDTKALWTVNFQSFAVFTATLVALVRGMPGSARQINARPDNEDMRPIEIWGYECSPFVRPVREKLAALCLPHLMVSCSRGSVNRDKLLAQTGVESFQVPYLKDPNTGIEMFEGPEIVEYLEKVYTVKDIA